MRATMSNTPSVKREETEDGSGAAANSASSKSATANVSNTKVGNNDLQVIFVNCGSCKVALEVKPSMALFDLSQKVVEDLDKQQIPGGGLAGGGFSFRIVVQDEEPTEEQLKRWTMSDVLRNNWNVKLEENNTVRVRKQAIPKQIEQVASQSGVNEKGKLPRLKFNRSIKSGDNHEIWSVESTKNKIMCSRKQAPPKRIEQVGSQAKADVNENGKRRRASIENEGKPIKLSTTTNEIGKQTSNQNGGGDFGVVSTSDDFHAKYDLVMKKSRQTLMGLEKMLVENKPNPNDGGASFCSEVRNEEWRKEIKSQLSSGTAGPKTVVGVLGSTGVGKSSLLNALLDEAAVLPTSGSRGCTAAVVELTYNRDLLQNPNAPEGTSSTNPMSDKNLAVYKGKVEFMKLQDWTTELKLLVDECSTPQEVIFPRRPEAHNHPDAAAAWAKLDEVYGKGTMAKLSGNSTASVFQELSTNTRVVNLLTPKPDSQEPYNAVYVEEGCIDISDAAKTVLCEYDKMGLRTRRNLKEWAKSFRSKINGYVYRKGNGNEAQTWPLIRCVSLQGPWNVLSSGAVLVDLPGVRDANAARARVSERYLQNCNQIWIVAPIKRAVDDGTAKELMGEQFKRRLLMDGQYGNIAFICTQTDDCEATEIMRDHEDIAVSVPGRWETMTDLRDKINGFEKKLSDLQQQQEDLKFAVDEAKERLEEITNELDDAKNPNSKKNSIANDYDEDGDDGDDEEILSDKDDDESGEDRATILELKAQVSDQKEVIEKAKRNLSLLRENHKEQKKFLTTNCDNYQDRLKAICAKVRNEYSTKCLQEDFISGLKEMYRDANESSVDEGHEIAIPTDISLPVFCISANDYLKVMGIKPSSDGRANCFSSAADTQIERLRKFVHETTALRRIAFTESFVIRSSDIVNRVKLLAIDSKSDGGSTKEKVKCKDLFEEEMKSIANKLIPIATDFGTTAKEKIIQTLEPSLVSGKKKARSSAMSTVDSWGSKHRRTKHERNAKQNGLYWSTYYATVRRAGVYVSSSAGPIDLNAELVEPMEAKFTPAWQSIMDGAFRHLLSETERRVIDLCKQLDETLLKGFSSIGIEKGRIISMISISSSNCTNTVRAYFEHMRTETTMNQRKLNRSLFPKVQQSMQQSYAAVMNVPAGAGRFDRMREAMHKNSCGPLNKVFCKCLKELLAAIERMVEDLSGRIDSLKEIIKISLSSVYSILWEDQLNHVHQEKILACRAACLPLLIRFQKQQDEVMKVLGIERPVLDLEIAKVETWEEKIEQHMNAAKQSGNFIEILDDSEEDEGPTGNSDYPSINQSENRVKKEMPSSTSCSHEGTMNQRIGFLDSSKGYSNCVDNFYLNEYFHVAVLVIDAELTVEKVLQGFFVRSVGIQSKFIEGFIAPGDIIKYVAGNSVDWMNLQQFNNAMKSAQGIVTITSIRSLIMANAGSLGVALDRVPQGYVISRISVNSQLKGRVVIGDVIIAIDGTRLSKLDTKGLYEEIKYSSDRPARYIWILRARAQTYCSTMNGHSVPNLCIP